APVAAPTAPVATPIASTTLHVGPFPAPVDVLLLVDIDVLVLPAASTAAIVVVVVIVDVVVAPVAVAPDRGADGHARTEREQARGRQVAGRIRHHRGVVRRRIRTVHG